VKFVLRAIRGQAGFTLIEMVIVVAIIAAAAAMAISKADPHAAFAADAAAGEIARALRFAQREAIRTGTYQIINIDPGPQVLRIYRFTASGYVTTAHPVDKTDYQISFAKEGMTQATIVSSVFRYQDGAVTTTAMFGPDGLPVDVSLIKLLGLAPGKVLEPKDASALKEDGKITLRYGSNERVVRVAPGTGRVSL